MTASKRSARLLSQSNKKCCILSEGIKNAEKEDSCPVLEFVLFPKPGKLMIHFFTAYLRTFKGLELIIYICFAMVASIIFDFIIPLTINDVPYHSITLPGSDESTPPYILKDLSLSYKYIPNHLTKIPDIHLGITAIVLPIGFFLVVSNMLFVDQNGTDTHNAICSYLTSVGVCELITDSIKRYVGRLRPNFYDMCLWNEGTFLCHASRERIEQSRKSFPSGHSR